MKNDKRIPGLRQLPSGTWNYRKYVNGHTHSFTFDHEPTKKELKAIEFQLYENSSNVPGTFKTAALKFLELRSEALSPSTDSSYRSILRNLSEEFLALKIAKISQVDIQAEINSYSKGRSPKSVKNASGFITTVMWFYRPEMPIRTKLPQTEKVDTYIPTTDEMKKLLSEIAGSPYEAAILLMIYGLRKSEAIAITADDIDGNVLTINKALVVNSDGDYVEKVTKTTSSTRQIVIPDYLADIIKENGKAYEGFPGNILRYLHRTQDALGINRCKLHALRHWYISFSHDLGIPDAAIAKAVGHSNTDTTRKTYLHAMSEKQKGYESQVIDAIENLR